MTGSAPIKTKNIPMKKNTRSGLYMAYMRTIVVPDRLRNCGMLRNSRDSRVLGFVAIGTEATLKRLLPAWISISIV